LILRHKLFDNAGSIESILVQGKEYPTKVTATDEFDCSVAIAQEQFFAATGTGTRVMRVFWFLAARVNAVAHIWLALKSLPSHLSMLFSIFPKITQKFNNSLDKMFARNS
jgi:hypothetical protein